MAGDLALRSVFAFKKPIKCRREEKRQTFLIKNFTNLHIEIWIILILHLIRYRCVQIYTMPFGNNKKRGYWGFPRSFAFNDSNNSYAQQVKSRHWLGLEIMLKCSVFQVLYTDSLCFFFHFFFVILSIELQSLKLDCTLSQVWKSVYMCPSPYRCANLLNINHITKHHIAIIIIIIIAPSAS